MLYRASNILLAGASAVTAALLGLAVAACGSGHGNAAASGTVATTIAERSATVGAANSGLGRILVNSRGRTLYLFAKDPGTTSTCTGGCAAAWPPLRAVGQPAAGNGADAALLGTTPRSDGGFQVTYNGHPLYLYLLDQKPGDTNGQGVNAFGASWFAVTPAGGQAVAAPAHSGAGTTLGGGGGY